MTAALLIDTENVTTIVSQMITTAQELQSQAGAVQSAAGSMEWVSSGRQNFDDALTTACQAIIDAGEQLTSLSERVRHKVQAWETAAASVADSGASGTVGSGEPVISPVSTPIPIPVSTPGPTPTPSPDTPATGITNMPEEIIRKLDDLLKPIDWVSDSAAATKKFNSMLEEIGRTLNTLTGQRGHIKMMGEFGSFMRGATDGVGFLNNILDLRDMNKYFTGQLTNSEVASVAIKTLLPIPILNDRLAQFLVQNMVDPGGHWHGLVRPAY